VVLDHEDIAGLMPAMIMPFDVTEAGMLAGVVAGDRVIARYELGEAGGRITRLRVAGHGPPPAVATGPAPLRVGEVLPATTLALHDGSTLTLGPAQTERVALTFVYTRCPVPEFCPAITLRLQALQEALGAAGARGEDTPGVRIVAVTLDPAYDTREVLAAWAGSVGAGPRWSFARLEEPGLSDLAMSAGLPVLRQEGAEIAHGVRLLVLDRGGALVERYDDARFPLDRVVTQLTTGGPPMPPGNSGTLTPE
jgi:protein SCO1